MFCYMKTDQCVELVSCLEGLGSFWTNYVYHLPFPRHYSTLSVVLLQMVNVLVDLKAFTVHWLKCKVLAKYDNEALGKVLIHGSTRNPSLGSCTKNIWQIATLGDVELYILKHIAIAVS